MNAEVWNSRSIVVFQQPRLRKMFVFLMCYYLLLVQNVYVVAAREEIVGDHSVPSIITQYQGLLLSARDYFFVLDGSVSQLLQLPLLLTYSFFRNMFKTVVIRVIKIEI